MCQAVIFATFFGLSMQQFTPWWVGRVQLPSREREGSSLDLLSCPMAVTLLDMSCEHTMVMPLIHRLFAPLLLLFKVT